jgi:Protein of unknown function (DUF3592)
MPLLASSPAQHFFTIFGGALFAFGVIFGGVGVTIRLASRRLGGRAQRAHGTIVGFDTSTPGATRIPGTRIRMTGYTGFAGSGPLYRPTVQFTTPDGTAVTATSPFGSNPRQGRVGDAVTVLYDRRNPQRVRVDAHSATGTCLEAAFILFGLAFAALGIVILVASR